MKQYWLPVALLAGLSSSAMAADFGHFTVFGQAGYSDPVGSSEMTELDKQSPISADFLYTYTYQRFSVLAEFFAGEDTRQLERFELGLRLNQWLSLKLGLLHNPAEYWLSEFHKGSYPRSSITNPFQSLKGFLGGGTSRRLSGVQLGVDWPTPNDGRLMLDYTYAVSPDMASRDPEVDADDFFGSKKDRALTIARLRYQPWSMNETSFGISYGDSELGIDQKDLWRFYQLPFAPLFVNDHLQQTTFNLYANIEVGPWRAIVSHLNERWDLVSQTNPMILAQVLGDKGTVFDIDLDYLHVERVLDDKFSVFARYEKVNQTGALSDTAALVSALTEFDLNYDKSIVGLRWDVAERQALTLQYSDHETFGQKQDMLHLSWSFVWDVNL